MVISEETVSKIQLFSKIIMQQREEGGIKQYNCQEFHRVFSLDTEPGLIFKLKENRVSSSNDDSMKSRYHKMISAQTVVRTHQLGLLVIPHATLFNVNFGDEEYEILAEQKLDINPNDCAQEHYFDEYGDSMNETIRQLALFICKTGYSDVEWRNNPVIDNSLDERGNRRIALIDIEEMKSSESGLFGVQRGLPRTGLVGLVNEEQGEIVASVAAENAVSTITFAEAKIKRIMELDDGLKLKQFYQSKTIVNGDESIPFDENAMDFSDHPEKIEKLLEITKDLIHEINEQIASSSSEKSVKGRRTIFIDARRGKFRDLDGSLVEPGEKEHETAQAFKTNEEYYNATFLGVIVSKMKDAGIIHNLVTRNGYGYYLQA